MQTSGSASIWGLEEGAGGRKGCVTFEIHIHVHEMIRHGGKGMREDIVFLTGIHVRGHAPHASNRCSDRPELESREMQHCHILVLFHIH
jgi:hypothetical protein